MRTHLLIAIILIATFALPACALLDGLLGQETVQVTDGEGRPLFEDAEGNLTIYASDPLTGKTNRPVMIELVGTRSPVISGASSLAARFGPWGALLGTLGTLGFGLYARVRNRQRLKEAGLKVQARRQLDLAASALTFVVQLVEKIKEGGAIDADGNGKISLGEVQEWVRGRGSRFKDPKFLAEVVRIANASLSPDDERRQLAGVLAGVAS